MNIHINDKLKRYALVDITLPPSQQVTIGDHMLTEYEADELNYARALNGNPLKLIKIDWY